MSKFLKSISWDSPFKDHILITRLISQDVRKWFRHPWWHFYYKDSIELFLRLSQMSISSSYILGHDSKAKLTRAQTYNLRVYSTTVPHLPDFKFLSCYLYFKLTMFLTYYLSSLCFLTAKQHRKFETNIPRKGIARPQPQFPHSCVCERFI